MANKPLPGIRTTIRDGGLITVDPDPVTERLLIIGNALDGPVNTPIRVRSLTEAEAIFGPLTYTKGYLDPVTGTESGKWASNSLVNGLYEALIGGAGYITLVRSGGTEATVTFSPTGGTKLSMSVVAPGRIYNGVVVGVTRASSKTTVTIGQPAVKGGIISLTVPDASTTLQELCDLLNSDVRNRTVIFSVAAVSGALPTSVLTANTSGTFAGGTNGTEAPQEDYYLNKEGYYTKLTGPNGTFDILVDRGFNVCLLTGIYGDDQVASNTTTSVAQAFAEFLHKVSYETMPCHGVLGLRPIGKRTPTELKDYADSSLLATSAGNYGSAIERRLKFGYFMYTGFTVVDEITGQNVDAGRYLSIVAGPDIVLASKDRGLYYTNGAAVYAGMITNTAAHTPTSNKGLAGVGSLVGNFPKATLEQLVQGVGHDADTNLPGGGAYVVFRTNVLRGIPIVIQDNTCAKRTSDYKTLQVFRIVNLGVQMVKDVLYPYLGEPASVEAMAAMKMNIISALNSLSETGALLGAHKVGYDFALVPSQVDNSFTKIDVTLRLRPALQIKYITVDVSVTS